MELTDSVEALEREAASLEARCASREAEVRAAAVTAEAELSAVEAQVADEERRLEQFTADLALRPRRPALTWWRGALAAAALGVFTTGAVASRVDLTRVSVGLFAAVWVAFLAGALRGR